MLILPRPALDRAMAHAVAEYPRECCGIISQGAGESAVVVRPCRNLQQLMHDQDPVGYPRDSRTAYLLDPGALLQVLRELESAGGRLIGFYHSHVDRQACFSAEDEIGALAIDHEPWYLDAIYLVISVHGEETGQAQRQVTGHRCFLWDSEARQFAEAPLQAGE